jgi:hypothetical protein
MDDTNENIRQLQAKLELLMQRQYAFGNEINALRNEITALKVGRSYPQNAQQAPIANQARPQNVVPINNPQQQQQQQAPQTSRPMAPPAGPPMKSDLEKFIGENLINKIGILITIIGVAIGAKYSIDKDLIDPTTRVILGYMMGLGLLAFGMKLKKNYENFSSVLVSGSIAILYFITFAAYSFYGILGQGVAFLFMFVFTAFTVVAALNYNKQVIAHIGLVGAYAVPFLLSDGSGKIVIFFSYVTIINIGILIIAYKKYWKSLYYSSFGMTWLIFLVWLGTKYQMPLHFSSALTFGTVFFLIFYSVFVVNKLANRDKFVTIDIFLILLNAFVYFGVGYAVLCWHKEGAQLLGIFTLANAVIHFGLSVYIYKLKLADRNLFFLISGLVMVFITIAIPIELNGNYVTMLWILEAALLFWIGRTKNVSAYEKLSYPLVLLGLMSLVHDWNGSFSLIRMFVIDETSYGTPLWNAGFMTVMIFAGALVFMNILHRNKNFPTSYSETSGMRGLINFLLPFALIFVLYFGFRIEISNYFHHSFLATKTALPAERLNIFQNNLWNYDVQRMKVIWVLIYSLFFFTVLMLFNAKVMKSKTLAIISSIISSVVLVTFLTQGLYKLGQLRASYLQPLNSDYFEQSGLNLGIRYIAFAFIAAMLWVMLFSFKQEFMGVIKRRFTVMFNYLLYGSVLWIATSELIAYLDVIESRQTYKLGISILWGVYALFMVVMGIWKRKKYIRVTAIALFGCTLIKLFLYDISALDTISKTIVFVSLGVLLLIVSFLYNKYTAQLTDEKEE